MTQATSPAELGEIRGGVTTGVALTSTASFTQIPDGTWYMTLIPRNFSTAVVARVALNPYLIILKTADALASAPTNYSQVAQDGSTSTVVTLSSLGTAAQLDFLYVGSHIPFRGVVIDVTASTNSTASVLTVKYWKNDSTWADITATDGTASGGASLAVDGNVTWTVPTDWQIAALNFFGEYTAADSLLSSIKDTALTFPFSTTKLYWTRWQFSGGLDASTTLASMLSMNRSTAYFEIPSGITLEETITKGPLGVGNIEALTDAGTANMVVDFATTKGSAFI